MVLDAHNQKCTSSVVFPSFSRAKSARGSCNVVEHRRNIAQLTTLPAENVFRKLLGTSSAVCVLWGKNETKVQRASVCVGDYK